MFNVATIVVRVALVPLMPAIGLPRIMAIAIAALVGGFGQIAVQWPALRREGFRYAPMLDRRDPGLREVVAAHGSGHARPGRDAGQPLRQHAAGDGQGTGAVSWLQYAFRLMYLPIGLFGVSIATAVLPAVSRHAAVDDRRAVARPWRAGSR